MAKHTDWVRARNDDPARTRIVQFEGRKLMGALMQRLRLTGNPQGKMSRTLADGTQISASFDGTTPIISVINAPSRSQPASPAQRASVWEPRGFVLYPVSDAAPTGWGIPVIPDETAGPYDAANLAPGLDTDRWTEGGQLGQVLLSKDPDAGYPTQNARTLLAPMLFHPTIGLRPTSTRVTAGDTWAAYRLEHVDYTSQSPSASDAERITARTFKRKVFELSNEQRLLVGSEPLLLPIRGHYDSAQATTEVAAAVNVIGHFYEGYPVTYRTADGRISKDGVTTTYNLTDVTPSGYDDRNVSLSGGENLTANSLGPLDPIGTDPNGYGIYRVIPGPPFTGQEAFDLWMTSTEHRGNIENTIYGAGGYTILSAGTLQVGQKGAYCAQHFIIHDQWVAAGNVAWHSENAEIPPVSYFGFNGLSLGFETWPIRPAYTSNDIGGGEYQLSAELDVVRQFEVEGTAGTIYETALIYCDHPDDGANRNTRPALSPRIFCRGRCIALAPRGGSVWAAAIQKVEKASPDDPQVYRLIALVHHHEDQEADQIANGMTNALRVWYCDLPDFEGYSGNPQTPIRGVYGEEDAATWPWLTLNSPYSWRGGTLVDMATSDGGTEPDMLKYASAWRFSPDATKAVCLRDFGTVADWVQMFDLDGGYRFGDFVYPFTRVLPGPVVYQPTGQFGHMIGGPRLVYVELALSFPGDGTVDVTRTTSAPNAGSVTQRLVTPATSEDGESWGPAAWIRPAAIDYDANGELKVAHHVFAYYGGSHEVPSEAGTVLLPNLRQGIYFGDFDARWPDVATAATWYSALAERSGTPETMFATPATVLDVIDETFVAMGRACPMTDEGAHPFYPGVQPDYPDFGPSAFDSPYRVGAFSASCIACGDTPSTYIVRMFRAGDVILDGTTSNPDATLYDVRLSPKDVGSWIGSAGLVTSPYFWWVHVPYALNCAMSASYQRNRAGEWVATLVVVPQLSISTQFEPGADTTTFSTDQTYSTGCFNDCGIAPGRDSTLHIALDDVPRDLGGWMVSSFAGQSALAELMNIPGANPRSLYARVV